MNKRHFVTTDVARDELPGVPGFLLITVLSSKTFSAVNPWLLNIILGKRPTMNCVYLHVI
jgi:hypothetical protein